MQQRVNLLFYILAICFLVKKFMHRFFNKEYEYDNFNILLAIFCKNLLLSEHLSLNHWRFLDIAL